ncbi:hypothetical protein BGZ65_009612 [Modicella reniformis]|uniref:Uncharacterized protein n=1 Tax=Modicella reniformis TaxID=1440133 RepID=A0A9P6M3B8_9FUNG|nr:hypothetical protein BGZ65_009612 [Modicella reniformis]
MLDVVVAHPGQVESPTGAGPSLTPSLRSNASTEIPRHHKSWSRDDTSEVTLLSGEIMPDLTQDVEALTITCLDDTMESLEKYTPDMSTKAMSSLRAYNQLYSSYFAAIMAGQEHQATGIKQAMDQHFGDLREEMDKNRTLQDQLLKMQEEMQLQHKTLDRLAIIQSRIQAVITQTYELHEFPIPRLFIVLPKATGLRDKLGKPFSHQFRLFFMCECGTHTQTEHSKDKHQIHLAKHEGYDLDRPTEFFDKYGSYVLTLMYAMKVGITAAGIATPSLANLKIAEGLDAVESHLEYVQKNISPLVDESITFLEGFTNSDGGGVDMAENHTSYNKLEVLECADLRQLESYIKVKDQGRVLGNLYRMVTPDGHVKWVCINHYRENYRESTTQQLRMQLRSMEDLLQFYDAMGKARAIQELSIGLKWDVTLDDLRKLTAAVTNSNIVHLTIDGATFKGPTLEIVNRSRRFDPLIQVMANGRFQSLALSNFDDFFLRANSTSLIIAPRLRTLSIGSELNTSEKTIKSLFVRILECCPSLKELTLTSQYSPQVMEIIINKINAFQNLAFVAINCERLSINADVSRSRMRIFSLRVLHFKDLISDDWRFIKKGHLTQLLIEYTPRKADESRLIEVLQENHKLSDLQIGCVAMRSYAIIDLVISTRANILHAGGLSALTTFEVLEEMLIPFDREKDQNGHSVLTAYVRFSSDPTVLDMTTVLSLQADAYETLKDIISDLFRRYGWSLEYLLVPFMFADHFTAMLDKGVIWTLEQFKILVAHLLNTDVTPLPLKTLILAETTLSESTSKEIDALCVKLEQKAPKVDIYL